MLTPSEDKWITVVTFLRDLRDRWAYVTNLYSAHDADEAWVKAEYEQNIQRVENELRAYLEGCCVDSGPSGEPAAGSGCDSVRVEDYPFGKPAGRNVVGAASAAVPRDGAGVDEAEERARQDALARCECVSWVMQGMPRDA